MFWAGRAEGAKRAGAGHLAERCSKGGLTRARVHAARNAEVALVTPNASIFTPSCPASATKTPPAAVAEGLSLATFAERADQQLDGEKKLALRRNFFWRAFHADCVFRCGLLEPNRFDCLSRSRPEGHQKSKPLRH